MTTKYFNVKQGLTTGNITLDGINGNITATNANLGNAISANFFLGDGGFLSNITGANVVGAVSSATTAGTVTGNAQANITSVGTLTSLSVTGNISSGNANLGNLATANFFHGVFDATSSSQPNITSVGNLSNLTVGNATSNVVLLDGNITATGTITANNFSGNFSGNVNVGGTNTTVLFNDNGSIQGSNAFTFNNVSNLLTINGNLIASNANLGNLATANYFSGSGNNLSNIQGANVTGQVGNALVAGTVYTNAQPNITSVGTLTSLDVNGTVTAVAFTANTGVFTGNGNGLSSIVGANVTGTVANATHATSADSATTAGTVTGNAQANITSVGTLTSLSVTGNANVGNLETTALVALGAGSFGANVNMNNHWVNNVGYPSVSSDAATKEYVDTMVSSGIAYHQPVQAATTTTLATATGGTISYNNGTAGVGANLTTTGTFLLIDGANVQTAGTRILVKNEANAAWNGIYEYTSTTVITRTADADEYGPDSTEQFSINDYFFVQGGTVNQGVSYIVSSPTGTITFGISNIVFAEFSSSRVYTAGTGLTLSGTEFSISNTAVTAGAYGDGDTVATFTVNEQGQLTVAANTVITANAANLTGTTLASGIVTSSLTTVGTLGSLAVTGDITGGNIYANGGTISASALTGTLTTNAQPNITSVGTLSSLTVTGNISGGNISTTGTANVGTLAVTGTSNLGPVGNVTITGGTNGYYLQTNGSGTLTWASVPSGTGINNGNSNVDIPSANGNINLTATGNTTMVVTSTGANIAGYANISGNLHAANLSLASGGNISGVNNISATTVTGTLTTASQPNITSVGTLAGLTANSTIDFTTASNVSLGPVANLHITGGTDGQYLKTDGAGTLTWSTVDSASLSNGTSNIQILNNGNITVSSAGNANVLVVTASGANITGTLNATGNANVGNLGTADIFATGNITTTTVTANVATGTAPFTVTSTTQVANLNVETAGKAGTVTTAAQPNITSVGTLTSLAVSGNITANYVAYNGGLTSNRSNVAVSSGTVIDQFSPSTFRTAKYIISASGDDGYQSVETLLIHDGTTAYITIYGSICSNVTADIIELSSNINGVSGNVSLYATGTSANLVVNLVSTYINT